ncbi:Uncharacterised protein [Acinetobacter baumannii]|uniref:hypothetical protein n=1 Tax=Acinetobacter genomosp. 33YU TaxID=1675530 RepID=UPI00097F7E3A|nr:hypothetical protein [Acinetobacter genomosp. 33YU]MCZ3076956.1 hypothetical protein [Acinetobacter baumannii]ONN58722.1 hypothetical protein AC057_02020 [Acinetobacter genomosp. 33YU]SSS40671.1 Uncharacterised protein [Acinetobacter baumannii]
MTDFFDANKARENLKLAKPDYEEIFKRILSCVEYNSKKGINPVFMSFSTSTITQENIIDMTNRLNQLGFSAKIKKDSPSSISVEVGF